MASFQFRLFYYDRASFLSTKYILDIMFLQFADSLFAQLINTKQTYTNNSIHAPRIYKLIIDN